MRALLVANAADADPGLVGERFRDHGFAFVECHRERPNEWPDLDGVDLVLQLGSDWSVYWPDVAAPVAAECDLVNAAVDAGIPIFGICFGAQVIAAARGGRVGRAPESEVGWYDVEPIGHASGVTIPSGPWMQWHYDRIEEVPPLADVLAVSSRAVQAFRIGRVLATQFHPEVDVSIVERWLRLGGAGELERLDLSIDDLRERTVAGVAAAAINTAALVDGFMESIAAAPLARR